MKEHCWPQDRLVPFILRDTSTVKSPSHTPNTHPSGPCSRRTKLFPPGQARRSVRRHPPLERISTAAPVLSPSEVCPASVSPVNSERRNRAGPSAHTSAQAGAQWLRTEERLRRGREVCGEGMRSPESRGDRGQGRRLLPTSLADSQPQQPAGFGAGAESLAHPSQFPRLVRRPLAPPPAAGRLVPPSPLTLILPRGGPREQEPPEPRQEAEVMREGGARRGD